MRVTILSSKRNPKFSKSTLSLLPLYSKFSAASFFLAVLALFLLPLASSASGTCFAFSSWHPP